MAAQTIKYPLDEPPQTVTFAYLLEHEPRLGVMDELCKLYRKQKPKGFCRERLWKVIIVPRLLTMLGWSRRPVHEVLSMSYAYAIAHDKLYESLPPCNHRGPCKC